MRLVTLGGLTLEGSTFQRTKPLLLLCYLAVEGAQPRRHLARLFYPTATYPLGSLASDLTRLRKNAPGSVAADANNAWTELDSDASELLDTLDRGQLEQAATLYRGRFLHGVHLKEWGEELEEWLFTTREFLAARIRQAHLTLAEKASARGDLQAAGRHAETAYLLPGAPEPEPEHFLRLYGHLHAADNPHATEVRKEAEEFGIAFEPAAAEDAAPEQVAGEPETSETTAPRPGTPLPTSLTSFVGRSAEIKELAGLLGHGDTRLLTLTGPGGIGKTRLALELARRQQDRYRDGVFFVPLDALSSPTSIPASIATSLGLKPGAHQNPVAQLRRYLTSKELLLVLDNYEHLLEGATLTTELLLACPGVTVLTTSRERLNLEGERVYPVEGLETGGVPLREAVQLFMERAKNADLRFEARDADLPHIVGICTMVGGSPLGIELAAAWVKLLSPSEIVAELGRTIDFLSTPTREATGRHHNFRAAFESSWKLLPPREQEVLRKLSVFRNGFRRDAASQVAGATIPLLASLVDKSLLRVLTDGRYDQHPTMREYALEKLRQDPEEHANTLERHGGYYLKFLEEKESMAIEYDPQAYLSTFLVPISEEFENASAAWRWALSKRRTPHLPAAATVLMKFSEDRGRYAEVIDLLTLAQERLSETEAAHRTTLGAAAAGLVVPFHETGQFQNAIELGDKAATLLRSSGPTFALSHSLLHLGTVLHHSGNHPQAKAYFQESTAVARALGIIHLLVETTGALAHLELWLGNVHRAEELLSEPVESSAPFLVPSVFQTLHYLITGRHERAKALAQDGLNKYRKMGSTHGIGLGLFLFAWACHELGEYPEAARSCLEALRLLQERGSFYEARALLLLGRTTMALDDAVAAKAYFERGLNQVWILEAISLVMEGLSYFAEFQLGRGNLQRAAEWLSLVRHHHASGHHHKRTAERLLGTLQTRLPPEDFSRALEQGATLELSTVMNEILGGLAPKPAAPPSASAE